MWTNWYVRTGIHEVVHHARRGVMGDAALAKTAYELGESDVVVIDEDTNDAAEILRYSSAWDNALSKFCGPR